MRRSCTYHGSSYRSSDTFDIRQSPMTYADEEFYQSRCLVDIISICLFVLEIGRH
jgi:hypothetical protein